MDAVNEASTVADDGLSVSTGSSLSASSAEAYKQQEEKALVSILVPPSLIQVKIPLPIMSGETESEENTEKDTLLSLLKTQADEIKEKTDRVIELEYEIRRLKRTHRGDIDQLKRTHRGDIDQLKRTHRGEIDQLNGIHEEEMIGKEKKISALKSEVKKMQFNSGTRCLSTHLGEGIINGSGGNKPGPPRSNSTTNSTDVALGTAYDRSVKFCGAVTSGQRGQMMEVGLTDPSNPDPYEGRVRELVKRFSGRSPTYKDGWQSKPSD